ncbi:hypothetical protein [Streptomyces sp. NPDC058683]|uniref:hypothetical protein n=1 Tax=Streptomyces sp. NPDC058683 TaxID=3346597 RepID=UPI003662B2D1
MDQQRENLINVFVSEGLSRSGAEEMAGTLTGAATDTACELLPGAERGEAWRWAFMSAVTLPPTLGALAEQKALPPADATLTARLLLGVGHGLQMRGQDLPPLPAAPTPSPALRTLRSQAETFVTAELSRHFGAHLAIQARLTHVVGENIVQPRDDEAGGWTLLAALEAVDRHAGNAFLRFAEGDSRSAYQLGRALLYGIALQLTAASSSSAAPAPRPTGIRRLFGRR